MRFLNAIEKYKFISFLFVVILIMAASFYWFELRPHEIRQYCFHQISFTYPDFSTTDKDLYEGCLAEHGLSK